MGLLPEWDTTVNITLLFDDQVYHTEAGARHRFFRVYPYMKQLRRWIKNKRKEGNKSKQPASSKQQGADKHKPHREQLTVPLSVSNSMAQQTVDLPSPEQDGNAEVDVQQGISSIPRPAPVAHCSAPEQPGQAWLNFALDRRRIMQHLVFPAVTVPVNIV